MSFRQSAEQASGVEQAKLKMMVALFERSAELSELVKQNELAPEAASEELAAMSRLVLPTDS